MNINLHIERLIVEETLSESGQQSALQRAVTSELSRLLSTERSGPGLKSLASTRTIVTGPISLQENSEPAFLGPQIAGAVFRGLEQ